MNNSLKPQKSCSKFQTRQEKTRVGSVSGKINSRKSLLEKKAYISRGFPPLSSELKKAGSEDVNTETLHEVTRSGGKSGYDS